MNEVEHIEWFSVLNYSDTLIYKLSFSLSSPTVTTLAMESELISWYKCRYVASVFEVVLHLSSISLKNGDPQWEVAMLNSDNIHTYIAS